MVYGQAVANAEILSKANIIVTIISLVSSFLMLWSCFKTQDIKSVSLKLIISIALSDTLYSISNFMSEFEKESVYGVDDLCTAEAFIRQFSFLNSLFWTTCTAILCYKASNLDFRFNQASFFRKAVLIGVSLCLFASVAPFLFPSELAYQNGSLFCWIAFSAETTTPVAKFLTLMIYNGIPVLTAVAITLLGYLFAIKKIRELPDGLLQQADVNVYKLLWYPLVLLIVTVPCIADNFVQVLVDDDKPVMSALTHIILTHSAGFANALVYGLQLRLSKRQSLSMAKDSVSSLGRNSVRLSLMITDHNTL